MENTNDILKNNPENNFNDEKEIKQNSINNINNNLFFTTETNSITNLEPGIQASFLKDLMDYLSLIKQSFSLYGKITEEMKFKSFEKYVKFFDIIQKLI